MTDAVHRTSFARGRTSIDVHLLQTFTSIPRLMSLPSVLVGLRAGFKVEKVPRLAAAFRIVMFAATFNATLDHYASAKPSIFTLCA